MIEFLISEIKDEVVRDNFQKLETFLRSLPFAGQWQFMEVKLTSTAPVEKIRHNLGFKPKDIITVSVEGDLTGHWLHSQFDRDYLYYNKSGPCVLRFFVGRVSQRL